MPRSIGLEGDRGRDALPIMVRISLALVATLAYLTCYTRVDVKVWSVLEQSLKFSWPAMGCFAVKFQRCLPISLKVEPLERSRGVILGYRVGQTAERVHVPHVLPWPILDDVVRFKPLELGCPPGNHGVCGF